MSYPGPAAYQYTFITAGLLLATCAILYSSMSRADVASLLPVDVPPAGDIAPRSRPLQILCFGDSLTFGSDGKTYENPHPYAVHLRERFAELGIAVNVSHIGHGGWATAKMLEPDGLAAALDGVGVHTADTLHPPRFDTLILLAGTNEAFQGVSPEDIAENIRRLHERAFAAGILRSVAVGIPPVASTHALSNRFYPVRVATNALLEAWAASTKDQPHEVHYVLSPAGLGDLLPDGVHFTPAGYARLGIGLADALVSTFGLA